MKIFAQARAALIEMGREILAELRPALSRRLLAAFMTTPRSSIGDAAEGVPIRVEGTIAALEPPIAAPIAGDTCVFYLLQVRELDEGADGRLLVNEKRGVPFLVVDDTGRAVIDPGHAEVVVVQDAEHRGTAHGHDDPRVRDLLRERGVTVGGKLWISVGTLRVGEQVGVLGHGVREPDPDPPVDERAYRQGPPMRLRMHGSARVPLYVTDSLDLLDE